jgi:hypothetical protein
MNSQRNDLDGQYETASVESSIESRRSNATRRNRYRVRRNLIMAFATLSRTSKVFLFLSLLYSLAQISAGVALVSLSFSRSEMCQEYLMEYCIFYILRLLVCVPLVIYERLYPVEQQEILPGQPVPFNEKLRTMVDFFGTIWFLFGNWWLFTSVNCETTAPYLYYLSLSYVVLGYLSFGPPLLIICSLIFCLPGVLYFLRLFHRITGNSVISFQSNERVRGADEETISRLKTVQFKGGLVEEPNCVICWQDYEEDDEIKFMPICNHHFHSSCVVEWLHVNKTCPLCRKDIEKMNEIVEL